MSSTGIAPGGGFAKVAIAVHQILCSERIESVREVQQSLVAARSVVKGWLVNRGDEVVDMR